MKKGEDYTGITVVFFCHDGNGNVLLSKRSINCRDEHGCWDPGGGSVEFGDTLEGTLRKEVKEEYCTDVLSFELLGFTEVFREHDGVKTHWIAFHYKVLIDPMKVKNGEPHKADEIAFFSWDNLPEPLHSQFPKVIALYGDKLK